MLAKVLTICPGFLNPIRPLHSHMVLFQVLSCNWKQRLNSISFKSYWENDRVLNWPAKSFFASWGTYNLDLSFRNNFLFGIFLSRDVLKNSFLHLILSTILQMRQLGHSSINLYIWFCQLFYIWDNRDIQVFIYTFEVLCYSTGFAHVI